MPVEPFYKWKRIETGFEHYLDAKGNVRGNIYHSMGGNWCFTGPFMRGQTPLKRDAKKNVAAQMGIPLDTPSIEAFALIKKNREKL